MKQKLDINIQFKITNKMYDYLKTRAQNEDRHMSEIVRYIINAQIRTESE